MNDLQIFNNDKFGQIRTAVINDEPYFMLADVCAVLDIKNTRDAKSRLSQKGVAIADTLTAGGVQQATFINESNLYKLSFTSRKPEAELFTDWVTTDVLPAIRKTGTYSMDIPKTLPEALRAYANEVEAHNETKAIVAQQEQQIAEFKPVKDYVDKILSSKSCLTITQIAADYGMSAQELNKILHEAGLQRKVGDQWILYKQHMAKGFTKSETFTFCRSDGRLDSKITTKWTQKGRLEIHNILSNLDIHAVCENVA